MIGATFMIRIGVNLVLAVVVFVALRDVGGRVLNGQGEDKFLGEPNQPDSLSSGAVVCPPCVPSECDFATQISHSSAALNESNAGRIFSLNNGSTSSSDGKQCLNDGVPLLDDCNCCAICVRKPNETCGGTARRLGICQPVSICWPVSPEKGVLLNGSEAGICIELLDANCESPVESKGCNLHVKRGCVCATISACQAVDFQYTDENECRRDWRKLKAMWQSDCLKAKCNVVFQPHCPSDSVFVPAPPPEPPDCCQKPGVCQCLPDACPKRDVSKTCPHGSDLILSRKASGKPGSCCDIYECHARGDECSGIICPATTEMGIDYASAIEGGNAKAEDDCPHDSFRPLTIRRKDGCCPVKDECRCRPGLCPPVNCADGFRTIIRKKGSGLPGNCCDEFECVENFDTGKRIPNEESTDRPTKCQFEGKSYEIGDTWRPTACIECTCKDGVNHCKKMECASSTCTRLVVPEGECCPVCVGCTTEDGEMHNLTDVWQKDDCTTCACETNGQVLCQKQFCKVECDHPVKVPGECCPKCDKPLIITLPQVCPSIELCPLRCEYGLKRNDRGCFLCECETDFTQPERDHYDQTSTFDPSELLTSSRRNCSSFDGATCSKKCAHGYEHDATGCPTCKCIGCPPIHHCYKHCLHGFQKNVYGCPICKCKGANLESSSSKTGSSTGIELYDLTPPSGDLSGCHSMSGNVRDHGEWWFDGCRHCYCDNGLEYCSLLACPPLNCTDPIYENGECCPRCPGSSQEGLVQRLVCHAPGSGRSYVEGEYWDLEPCIRCTCHVGHVLCHKKLCPPAPCRKPMTPKDQCCPVCADLHLPEMGASDNVTFCQSPTATSAFADGSIWKASPCESCVCRDTEISCYRQMCPLTGCTGRLLQVKHDCCPVCTGNLENGACRFSDSVVYSVGEQWRDGPCRNCSCVGDGETLCSQVECSRCLNATPVPGQCCPQCNDDDYAIGETDWKSWTTMPSPTLDTGMPELPGSNSANHQTSLVLLSCCAGIFVILIAIILIICWCRKRDRQHSHRQDGCFGLFRKSDANGGARLTNFPGYDPSKSMPIIADDRNHRYEQTRTLLNTEMNGGEKVTQNGSNAHRYRPDLLLNGDSGHRKQSYDDERNSKAVRTGTLLYEYEVGGWDIEKV